MKKNLSFIYNENKKFSEENRVLPVPQIIINDISVNVFNGFQSTKSFNKSFLFPSCSPGERRARSFSPIEKSYSPSIKKMPPSPSQMINVKTKKAQFEKKRSWLINKREILSKRSIELTNKKDELRFLIERREFLIKEMKNYEAKRNKLAILTQMQKDNSVLNGLFLEILLKKEEIIKAVTEKQKKNFILTQTLALKKKKNEILKQFFVDFKAKFQKFKFLQELTIINLAIQKEDLKKKKLMFFR